MSWEALGEGVEVRPNLSPAAVPLTLPGVCRHARTYGWGVVAVRWVGGGGRCA